MIMGRASSIPCHEARRLAAPALWIALCLGVFVSGGCGSKNPVSPVSTKHVPPTAASHPVPKPPSTKPSLGPHGFADRDRPDAAILPISKSLHQPVIALCWHDIIPRRTASSVWFDCTVAEFKEQLATMTREGCTFISIQQLYDAFTKGTQLPPKPVVLTFADGYEGFYRYAVPILSQQKIPVAQFVHTGFVGSQVGRPKMTWDQLEELDRKPWITIGSQTVTHPADLRQVHGGALAREMEDSRAALESHFHHKVRWLAYPNGKFNAEDEAAAKAAGYLMAFCEHQRPCQESPSIYAVNRYVDTLWKTALHDGFGEP